MHRDPGSLDFVEVSEVARPHRVDRVFAWKERDFNLHDATNRVEVTLLGNEVAGYREYLKVPDQWKRDYQRLRSKNEVASTVRFGGHVGLLFVGLLIVIVMRVRRHDIRWQQAASIGMIGMALSFCSQLNQFPCKSSTIPPPIRMPAFLAPASAGVVAALGAGGLLFVLAAGAEPLYREAFPAQISLGNLFAAARTAHQALLPRVDSGDHADRNFHRVSDGLLHRGLQVRRLVARRRAL